MGLFLYCVLCLVGITRGAPSVSQDLQGAVSTLLTTLQDNTGLQSSAQQVQVQPSLNLDLLTVLRVVAQQELQNEAKKLEAERLRQAEIIKNETKKFEAEAVRQTEILKTETRKVEAEGLKQVEILKTEAENLKAGGLRQAEALKAAAETAIDKIKQEKLNEENVKKAANFTRNAEDRILALGQQVSELKTALQQVNTTSFAMRMRALVAGLDVISLGNRTYVFSKREDKWTWTEANDFCKQYDMQLVTVETPEENRLIVAYLKQKSYTGTTWTSMTNLHTSNYTWMTGQAVTYGYWRSREPDNPTTERCVGYYYQEWISQDCSVKRPFLCEIL